MAAKLFPRLGDYWDTAFNGNVGIHRAHDLTQSGFEFGASFAHKLELIACYAYVA